MPSKRQPIKNYTTKVDPSKTAGEISGFLAARGARAIQIEYDDGRPNSLSFSVEIDERRYFYRLPCRAAGVYDKLCEDRVPPKYRSPEHARRVAWRITKDWLLAQFAMIDAGAVDLPEVFLPYLLVTPTETLYSRFLAGGGALQLQAGEPEKVVRNG